jgi:hypothetical protein
LTVEDQLGMAVNFLVIIKIYHCHRRNFWGRDDVVWISARREADDGSLKELHMAPLRPFDHFIIFFPFANITHFFLSFKIYQNLV